MPSLQDNGNGGLCEAGRAKLWADYLDEVIGKPPRELKEVLGKAAFLVTVAFKESMEARWKDLEEQVDSILSKIEEDVRSECQASGSERFVSMAGSFTAPESLSGPPYYYEECQEAARLRTR